MLQDGIKRICQCENTEEVLNCLLNLFGTLIKQNTEGTDERNRKLVQSVLSYIEKNYSGDLSMDDLTEKFHVSRTYISRLLKKYAGKSFLEYLTDVRFQQVEKLIADNKYKQYELSLIHILSKSLTYRKHDRDEDVHSGVCIDEASCDQEDDIYDQQEGKLVMCDASK